jgi:hypothetical protein
MAKQIEEMPQESIASILNAIKEQDQAWGEFITNLPKKLVSEPVDGSWSALYTLIHITAWIENALRVARLQADPSEPDPGPNKGAAGYLHIDVERFNTEVIEAHRGMGRAQALAWSHQSNADLWAELQKLPVERVLNGAGQHGARMWYWRPAFIHSRGHRRRVEQRIKAQF